MGTFFRFDIQLKNDRTTIAMQRKKISSNTIKVVHLAKIL